MTKVCRLCLVRLQRGSKYFNINAVESFTGFMPYRDQLTTCIPEMALDLIPNPVICNNCRNGLKSSYEFKSRCLQVEKKIRQYVETYLTDMTNYDLTQIDTSDLSKPAKFEAEHIVRVTPVVKEPPRLVPILPKNNEELSLDFAPPSSILSNLLTVRDELILPSSGEIEITNIKYKPNKASKISQQSEPAEVELTNTTNPITQDGEGMFSCNHCKKKFPNVPSLHSHKTKMHEEDYLCNFCNIPFKSLQCLRKHNQLCQKVRTKSSGPNAPSAQILTKRPHLPTKAKNHLKKWLFNHTDHPYPTDVEKQQLMKETNLSLLQVENWFINARRRILADLTRLKNMTSRGKVPRPIRPKRGRGRARSSQKITLETLNEDLADEEEYNDESASAADYLMTDVEAVDSAITDFTFDESNIKQEIETFADTLDEGEASEPEESDKTQPVSKPQEDRKPNLSMMQDPLENSNEEQNTSTESRVDSPAERNDEGSESSEEDVPLSKLGITPIHVNIKMEVEDVDER
ncbi:uncharacterized protein LOC126738972 [Anthonomus grandis grandis]|uniref:uncharacterized protein LOC126738972 n=1 Tax=Anthonomus grandis grandis TaxID=2921223 RepID=UPI00216657DA|nr:uncharacterized protein LOC126738972 [Anthonomus grandis grandis]